ncbi:MAG: glycosyltransferase family 39 protein [Candidatus Brocadiia bacterium]
MSEAEGTPEAGTEREPSLWRLLLVVALVAAAVRVICFAGIMHDLPLHTETLPGLDMHTYNEWAQEIAGGDVLSRERGVFYYTPLYPYLLAGVYLLGGPGNVLAGVVLNGFFGVAAAVCAAGLGRRLFGHWAGLAAGLLMALNGPQLYYESLLLVDSLLTALCLGGLWLLVEWWLRARDGNRVPLWRWLLPGLLFGVAAVGRTSNLLLAGALAVVVGLTLFRRIRRRAAAAAGLVVLGAVIVVSPFVVRNGLMHDRWTLTTNGPVLLYIGNVPGAPGIFSYPPGFDEIRHSYRDGPFWMDRLKSELAERPLSIVPTMLRKTALFFNAWDVPDNGNYHFARRQVASVRFFTVGPLVLYVLGFLGVGLTARDWRRLLPMYAFAAAFAASIIVVFVVGRYKLPFLGWLAVFGGGAVASVVHLARGKRWRALGIAAVAAAVLAALFWPRPPIGKPEISCPLRPNEYLSNARVLEEHDRPLDAARMLGEAADLWPRIARLTERSALLYLREDRPGEALERLEKTLRAAGANQTILEHYVVALWELGRIREAQQTARRLLQRYPDSEVARRALGMTGQAGETP